MEVVFHGAAREVTGSCHILRVNGKTVLLDVGMFQGRRAEAVAKNVKIPVGVDRVNAVVLSHAHIDHSGRLPYLVREGFPGTIFCTPATHDLCAIMLADSAHIQMKDAAFLARHGRPAPPPLYDQRHVVRTIKQMVSVPYDREFDVVPGVGATFVDAGHILGSPSVILQCTKGREAGASCSQAMWAAGDCRSFAILSHRPGRTP